MIEESREEYKEICIQVRESSASVMRYSSLVVAFSGGLFAALIRFNGSDTDAIMLPISLIVLANMTLFIQLIINYKSSSHNRLAAYRNLIAAEKFHKPEARNYIKKSEVEQSPPPSAATSFDVCMDHLNHTYANEFFDFKWVAGDFFERRGVFKELEGDKIDRFVSESFPGRVKFYRSGMDTKYLHYGEIRHDSDVEKGIVFVFVRLILMMFGCYKKKGTWGFPDHVNRMITFIVLLEILIAGYAVFNIFQVDSSLTLNQPEIIFIIVQLVISIILLRNISIYWQELMIGGKRIFSYFVQFVPFRMIYLKEMYGEVKPYYIGNEWHLEQERKKK